MKIKTHYDNLKVDRDASPDDIKRAFRKLTFKHHPDRCPPEQKALQERRLRIIKEAYDVLSDPLKRASHDAWIAQQEKSTQHEQHRTHDEKQTYENYEQSQTRQANYYQGLYRDQHALNLKLQEDIRELARQNERLSAFAKEMIRDREAVAIENVRLNEYNHNIVEAYNKTIEETKKTRQKNRVFAFFLIGIIGFMGYKSYHDFSPSVKAVLGDNLLSKSEMSVPSWKVSDWYRGEMVLTRVTEKRYEFLSLVNHGNVTEKMIRRGVQGSFKGLPECDKNDPNSAISQGKVARYRFVLLEKNVVVSTTATFSYLCR